MSNRILPFALAVLAGSLPSIGCKSSNLFTPPASLAPQADRDTLATEKLATDKLAGTEKASENVSPLSLANQTNGQDKAANQIADQANDATAMGEFQLSLGDQGEQTASAPTGNSSANLPAEQPDSEPHGEPHSEFHSEPHSEPNQVSAAQVSEQLATATVLQTSLTAESELAESQTASGVTSSFASAAKRTLASIGLSNPAKNFLSRESLADELAEFESFPFAFNLPNVAGEQVDSTRFGGQLMVIDVWATWCGPCRKAIPEFVALQSEFESHGVQVIGITCDSNNPDDAAETARKAYNIGEKMNVNYPLLVDDGTTRPQIPGFRSFPTTLFVTADGQVRYLAVGVQPQERMTAIIRAILDI